MMPNYTRVFSQSDNHVAFEWRMSETLSTHSLGKPISRQVISYLDFLAVLVSLCCFTSAAVVINPKYLYAALLGFGGQIMILGLLIAVQTLCLQRVLPYALALVEAQYGKFTLQNIEGILRSSPVASRLCLIWRIIIVVLKIMPIALGVGYKQFIGGFAYSSASVSVGNYGPTAPPGLQSNALENFRVYGKRSPKHNAAFANATTPFLVGTSDDVPFPIDLEERPRPYGFSSILISNTSAASIDAPLPNRIRELQKDLKRDAAWYLTTKDVRGTVAQYNATIGDEAYWNQTFDITHVHSFNIGYELTFVMIHQTSSEIRDTRRHWNGSWALVGTMGSRNFSESPNIISYQAAADFIRYDAMRFDVKRHRCSATRKITRSSVELEEGRCDPKPLDYKYQIYDNSESYLAGHLISSISEHLGEFSSIRKHSHWRVAAHTFTIAMAYHSYIAAVEGLVEVEPYGPLWRAHKTVGYFNETYPANESIRKSVPTLRHSPWLYLIVGIQPAMTLLALIVVALLFRVPISRNLGLVSLLAGADQETLKLLKGAAYSGELLEPVSVRIDVSHTLDQAEDKLGTVKYYIGDSGSHGIIRRGYLYT